MKKPERRSSVLAKENSDTDACTKCGRVKDYWGESEGNGYTYRNMSYCCSSCAEGLGCVCDQYGKSEPIARIEEGQ